MPAMDRVLLRGGLLLDPEASQPAPGALLLRDGRIEARLPPDAPCPESAREVALDGCAVAPGFVDLHFHGSLIFGEPAGAEAALRRDAASLARHGTTAFLATTVAWSRAELPARVGALAEALDGWSAPGAVPLGIHLEGPWIHAGAAGAQPRAAVRAYDADEGRAVLDRGAGRVRLVTFAPEIEGGAALQGELVRRGILAALGHSLCGADEVEVAADRGARHVTHLFNAMGPLHHRAPGLAGAALADDRLTCDLVCDGAHVDRRVVKLAARALGQRLVLVTDHIDPPPGAEFGSGPLRDDGVALRLPDGTLAGSRLTLDHAVKNANVFAEIPLLEAVAACTLRPARLLGVEAERGTLRPGARADLAVLDGAGPLRETWLAGVPVHPDPGPP